MHSTVYRTKKLPENNIQGCILASEIFEGIEVDVHWHEGHFLDASRPLVRGNGNTRRINSTKFVGRALG